MRQTALGLVAGLLFVACASRSAQAPPPPPYTGPLDFPGDGTDDFFDRQRIVATYQGHSFGFDAVLQKRGHELTLLGLTPFGSRAFVVAQKGGDVSFQAYVGTSLPFPPRYMLIDVHRVFFPHAAPGEAAPSEGERTFFCDDEVVTERWHDGRVSERTFSRTDGRPVGKIVVDYEGTTGEEAGHPRHVTLTNGWYGYRLDITTVSHKPL
jgi:uncharacterized protein DUF3261